MAGEIELLTDQELRKKLRSFNLPDGPITKTTRKLFESKLGRAMGYNKDVDKASETQEQDVKYLSSQGVGDLTNINGYTENNSYESNSPSSKDDKNALVDPANQEKSTFYGVCLQSDNKTEIDSIQGSKCESVFTDKTDALHCVKENNGARFRAFSTRNEAEEFASGKLHTPSRQYLQELSPAPTELTSDYKGPKLKELSRFRNLVEKGEADDVSTLIYGNPKYLLSSCNTPVIIQEGCHYNSLHVAAKAGQRDVCKIIIDALNDDNFWKLMYPNELHMWRKEFLLDLYLNTPEKWINDTPLHFACKFGKADVVEYLLSCPSVERTIPNKDGKTAEQVICARVDCDDRLRSKIQNMFSKPEAVCVPILRADDNCSSPKIGKPCSPRFHGDHGHEDVADAGSPGGPRYKVRAYAGPMSPQEADQFCYTLRSPRATPDKQAKFRSIKRSDSEKGLERVARKLAKSQNVFWCEYWKFLDCFTDLSTGDGLAKLEEYLKVKTEAHMTNVNNAVPLKTPVSSKCPSVGSLRGLLTGEDVYDGSENTPAFDSDLAREMDATPSSGFRKPNSKSFRNRLILDESPDTNGCVQLKDKENGGGNDLGSNLGNTNDRPGNGHDINRTVEHKISICHEEKMDESKIKERSPVSPGTHSLSPDYPSESLDVSNCSEDSLSGLIPKFRSFNLDESPTSSEESHRAKIGSECSPPDNGILGEVEDTRTVVDRSDVFLFIEGLQPSKVDLDVLRTVKVTTIDLVAFPYISRWQKMVQSFSKNTRQAWPSPGSPRYYKTRKGIPRTWSC